LFGRALLLLLDFREGFSRLLLLLLLPQEALSPFVVQGVPLAAVLPEDTAVAGEVGLSVVTMAAVSRRLFPSLSPLLLLLLTKEAFRGRHARSPSMPSPRPLEYWLSRRRFACLDLLLLFYRENVSLSRQV
jgi:hypothetical protein